MAHCPVGGGGRGEGGGGEGRESGINKNTLETLQFLSPLWNYTIQTGLL